MSRSMGGGAHDVVVSAERCGVFQGSAKPREPATLCRLYSTRWQLAETILVRTTERTTLCSTMRIEEEERSGESICLGMSVAVLLHDRLVRVPHASECRSGLHEHVVRDEMTERQDHTAAENSLSLTSTAPNDVLSHMVTARVSR